MNNEEILHEEPLVVHDLDHDAHVHHHQANFYYQIYF